MSSHVAYSSVCKASGEASGATLHIRLTRPFVTGVAMLVPL